MEKKLKKKQGDIIPQLKKVSTTSHNVMITSLKQSLLTHTHTHNHLSYDPNRTGIKQGEKKKGGRNWN